MSHHDRSHNEYQRHEREYKKDRSYESLSDSRQRKNSSDSRYIDDNRHSSRHDKYGSRSSRYDDERYSPHYNKKSSLSTKTDRKYTSGSSSFGYTPSPPPAPPVALPPGNAFQSNLQHTSNTFKDNTISMTNFVNRAHDPRIANKPTKGEPKQNFKLLIDPSIKKGHSTKIIRYDGVLTGQQPVVPKDPRRKKSKIWSIEEADLPLPSLKHDKNYVGPMPRDTVRFSNLNDNIDRKFLHELCEIYGDIKEYKVYFDPKTNRHTGTGKVVFEENTPLNKIIKALNGRSVMGKVITVWLEEKAPPGALLLKQLEIDCAKSKTRQIEPPPPPQIIHRALSTPRTPDISSLQRTHPVAVYGIKENFFAQSPKPQYPSVVLQSQPPPPPPPPTISGIPPLMTKQPPPPLIGTPPPPPPLMDLEDISPTGNHVSNKNWTSSGKILPLLKNVKRSDLDRPKSPLERRKHLANRRTYSPVSNSSRSISPVSPGIKDLIKAEKRPNKFESISDNESISQIEDISPAGTPRNKSKLCDDDAMSLSSISSNEEQKFETNSCKPNLLATSKVNNVINISKNQTLSYNNDIASSPRMVPRFFTPPQIQVPGLTPSNPLLSELNWTQQFPIPPFVPSLMFPNNRSQMVTPAANMTSTNRSLTPNVPFNMRTKTNMLQPQSFSSVHTMLSTSIQNTINTNSLINTQSLTPKQPSAYSANTVPNQPMHYTGTTVPQIPSILPFVFQVKAGCARDISLELKRILARDTLKKLVEQSAFSAFENWWENQKSSNSQENVENALPKVEKVDSESTRKLLADKSSNVIPQPTQAVKDSVSTSAMLQNLFGYEKNNENQPPAASFLNSFRISRKPQAKPTMKVSHMSRKRRSWPLLSHGKNKQVRLEDSEDDEEDDDNDKENDDFDEDQFEMFARRQRQTRKSGSSLYQKIHSDESNDEDETEKELDSQTDEDEHGENTERSSSDNESSSETSSSETDSSETDSEDEEEVEEEESLKVKKKTEEDSQQVSDVTSAAFSHDDDDDTETEEERVIFRSMYDEPRKRRAVQQAEERLRKTLPKAKPKKERPSRPPRPRKPAKTKPVKRVLSEDSETESAVSSEDEIMEVEENNVTIDESKMILSPKPGKKMLEEVSEEEEEETEEEIEEIVEEEVENEVRIPSEEELLARLIFMEHDYFSPPPVEQTAPETTRKVTKKIVRKVKRKRTVLAEKQLNEQVIEEDVFKPKFTMRSTDAENELLWDILKSGVDEEDLCFFKEAFESLHQVRSKDLCGLLWADYPVTNIAVPKPKRVKGEGKLRIHQKGCARAEGYYKIPMVEKALYLKSALRQLNILQQNTNTANSKGKLAAGHKIKSRENRAMQRRLASSIAQEEYGSLINYNQTLKMRKKALRFAKSSIHNWGLFTCEPIPADQFVCEYVGQSIRAIVAELRERNYERMGIGSSYLFRLDMESVIDATKAGCNARFINHSCQPNCYAKVILVEGAKKIVIYSKRIIKLGEEITYDYKFPLEDDKISCLCGAPGCRGSLN